MTNNQRIMNSVFVRYEGTANFRFMEGEDFFDDDIESVGECSEAEYQIESACPEIDNFTITHAEYDGECLSVNARISGIVLVMVPWEHSDKMQPDQTKFLEASVVSYLSAGVDCVERVNVTLSTQDHTVIAAT
ncbi:hypothetical protein AB1L30_10400 [Bremerella sp. JC817]|uniref:hypothetical protein n=1 Tax=Bremerella sp. JC817 TaxID=3231756 RepID=UPI00345A41C1